MRASRIGQNGSLGNGRQDDLFANDTKVDHSRLVRGPRWMRLAMLPLHGLGLNRWTAEAPMRL